MLTTQNLVSILMIIFIGEPYEKTYFLTSIDRY